MVSRSSPRRGSWSVGWLAGWWLIGRWVVDWSASGRLVDTRLIGGWWTSAVSPPVVVGDGVSGHTLCDGQLIKLVSRNSWLYLFVMFIFLLIGLSLDIYLIVYTSTDIVLVYCCRYMWSMYSVVVNVYYVKQNKILVSFIHIYIKRFLASSHSQNRKLPKSMPNFFNKKYLDVVQKYFPLIKNVFYSFRVYLRH